MSVSYLGQATSPVSGIDALVGLEMDLSDASPVDGTVADVIRCAHNQFEI